MNSTDLVNNVDDSMRGREKWVGFELRFDDKSNKGIRYIE